MDSNSKPDKDTMGNVIFHSISYHLILRLSVVTGLMTIVMEMGPAHLRILRSLLTGRLFKQGVRSTPTCCPLGLWISGEIIASYLSKGIVYYPARKQYRAWLCRSFRRDSV